MNVPLLTRVLLISYMVNDMQNAWQVEVVEALCISRVHHHQHVNAVRALPANVADESSTCNDQANGMHACFSQAYISHPSSSYPS